MTDISAEDTIKQQVPTIADIYFALLRHIDRERDMQRKVDELYSTVVVGSGDGKPSLSETVRRHEQWINNVNKLMWMFIAAVIGQMVVGGCSLFLTLFILLKDYAVKVP